MGVCAAATAKTNFWVTTWVRTKIPKGSAIPLNEWTEESRFTELNHVLVFARP